MPPLPYEERKIAVGLGGGEVYALAIDPESALLEYLAMYYRLGRAGKALDRFGIIDFATTIAPGVRDVLLTGKVYEAARRRNGNDFAYDAVIMDAPPTGRITRFLNVNAEVAGLAKVGPIRRQADSIMEMMRSQRRPTCTSSRCSRRCRCRRRSTASPSCSPSDSRSASVILNLVRPSLLSAGTREALEAGNARPRPRSCSRSPRRRSSRPRRRR